MPVHTVSAGGRVLLFHNRGIRWTKVVTLPPRKEPFVPIE